MGEEYLTNITDPVKSENISLYHPVSEIVWIHHDETTGETDLWHKLSIKRFGVIVEGSDNK